MKKLLEEDISKFLKPKSKKDILKSIKQKSLELSKCDTYDMISYIEDTLDINSYDITTFMINKIKQSEKQKMIEELFLYALNLD